VASRRICWAWVSSTLCSCVETLANLFVSMYSRFADRVEKFRMPMIPSDEDRDRMMLDFEAMGITTCDDPAEPGTTVDCCTYEMKMRFASRILGFEQDATKVVKDLEDLVLTGAAARFF
jgi:hypothetical protein